MLATPRTYGFPTEKKVLRVGIVGADGKKWKGDQELRMKEYIKRLLISLSNKELIAEGLSFLQVKNIPEEWKYMDENRSPEDWELWDATTKPVEFDELIIVSGHCPVGTLKWFCLECNTFIDDEKIINHTENNSLGMIRVYDQGGVDTWTEIIASRQEIKIEIYPAEVYQWEDKKTNIMDRELVDKYPNDFEKQFVRLKGYKSRNIQIAEVCDILIDIESARKCKYCKGTGIESVTFENSGEFSSDEGTLIQNECQKCEGDGAYSGGTWTYKYARKLGKEVYKVIIK